MKDHYIQLLKYDNWANQTLLNVFDRQFPQNQRIYTLFSHLLSAQRVWLDRCLNLPASTELWKDRLPGELQMDCDNYHLAWLDFITEMSDDQFHNEVTYKNTKGDEYNNKLSDIITHVVNHGTHHRGSIVVLMKEEGFVPPLLDFIYYIRISA
jgi:uncharacterized damage-inducible protein DinB